MHIQKSYHCQDLCSNFVVVQTKSYFGKICSGLLLCMSSFVLCLFTNSCTWSFLPSIKCKSLAPGCNFSISKSSIIRIVLEEKLGKTNPSAVIVTLFPTQASHLMDYIIKVIFDIGIFLFGSSKRCVLAFGYSSNVVTSKLYGCCFLFYFPCFTFFWRFHGFKNLPVPLNSILSKPIISLSNFACSI